MSQPQKPSVSSSKEDTMLPWIQARMSRRVKTKPDMALELWSFKKLAKQDNRQDVVDQITEVEALLKKAPGLPAFVKAVEAADL